MQEDEGGLTRRQRRELAKEAKQVEKAKGNLVSNLRKLLVWGIVGVITIYLGYRAVSWIKTPSPNVQGNSVEITENDWVKGDKEASTTLIEYGDFECPACATYYSMVKQLVEEVPQGFRVVYRHFPLVSIHKKAMPAAQATEAAGLQGKFWEMHDLLYEKHDEWVESTNIKDNLVGYARNLALDVDRFEKDFDLSAVKDKVQASLLSATRLGLNSTPTFFLNGVKIEPRSYEEFKKLVEDKINETSGSN